jgi:opacity protein-like surface antigen
MIFYNYNLINFSRVSIGINTGYGWSYNKVSNLNEYLPNSSLEAIINSNNKKSSAYSFGVKINFMLTNKLHIILGYRYSNLGKFASGITYSNTDNPSSPSSVQQITGNLKINEAYLRLAFFFS